MLLLLVASVALGNNNEGLVLEFASFSSLQKRTRTYRKPRKLLNFGEHANKMSDAEFRRFYRVTRGRFGWLCGNLRSTLAKKRARISPEVTLAISLRYLAGGS